MPAKCRMKAQASEREIQKLIDEIQGILKIMKDPKDALIRLAFWNSSFFSRHMGGRLGQNLSELRDACIADANGEELLSHPVEWERGHHVEKEFVALFLSAYSRIFVRYGMRNTRTFEWINYILGKLESDNEY